jgi:hypothetical protein
MVASTSSRITTDHDTIRCWAEERGAKPVVIFAGKADDDPGTVRLEFPGSRDKSLREIGWDEWFQKFDRSRLALLYQEQTADGERSSFCKIVHREKADEVEDALGGRGRSAARRGSSRAEKSALARSAADAETSSEPGEGSRLAATGKAAKTTGPARKPQTRRRVSKKSSSQQPSPDSQPLPMAMERTTAMEPEGHVDQMMMRSDEDLPIPIPPGEEPPPPVKEPPDTPVIAPDSPVREPGPAEPRRL